MPEFAYPVCRFGRTSFTRQSAGRKARFVGGTALGGLAAMVALALSPAAQAQSCGGATSGTVTCTAAGNPYAAGITVTPTADLTLIINPDVMATGPVTVLGTGLTHVTNNGTITTSGAGNGFGGGAGIGASGTTGVIVDGAGTVTTGGIAANGITARSFGGNVNVAVGNVTTTGANANGIFGYANGAGNVVITSTGTVSATGGGGTGNLYGVYGTVQGGAGAVTINANNVTVGGGNATGISAKAQGGPINITFGTVKSDGGGLGGAFGVRARNYNGGNVTISGANVATTGDSAIGIFADSNTSDPMATNTGAVSVTSTGLVSTTGANATAILVSAQGGPATVLVNNVSTTGSGATGVVASSATGVASVINNGTITTTGDGAVGISAYGGGGVAISGTGSVSTGGASADAIVASSTAGNVSIAQGDATATGALSRGVVATSGTGNVTLNVGAVSTTGTQGGPSFLDPTSTGIFAQSGSGNVAVTAVSASTAAAFANGITARSPGGGNVSVNVGDVTTTGANANGIFGYTTGAGNVVITSTGTVSATGGGTGNLYGVYGTVQGGAGAVTINANNVNVSGGNATAISAKAQDGPIAITFGSIKSDGGGLAAFGVRARSYGGGNVTVSGANIATTGDFAYGVFADSNNTVGAATNTGAASVTTTGLVSTTGTQAAGIGVFAQGGPATVVANNVSVTGNGATAIIASSATGSASVTANGTVSAIGGSAAGGPVPDAITVTGGTTAALTVGSAGSVSGTGNGVTITSATGSSVNNAGTINTSATGYAIQAVGGPATITNSGTINGRILLAGTNNTLTNSGTFNANADSNFGPGTNVVNNSGTFAVLPGTAAPGTVTLTGLTAFNNSGTVTLINGHTGDTLVLPGTFTGTGGRLGIDVAFGNTGAASASDQLVVNGAISGSTAVVINTVGANGAVLNPGVAFATGGAGTSPTAFTVAPQSVNSGFIHYDVVYNAAANSFSLVATPGDAVFRTLKINEGAQQLWYKSADAWSAHMSDLRDSHSVDSSTGTGRLWGQFYGGTDARRSTRSFSAFGQTRDVRTSYNQDAFGGQLGLDLGTIGHGGTAVFGITGGYVNSDLTFRASADRVNYSSVNGGAYVNLVAHGLFFNALGKYDYSWIYSTSPLAGYSANFHGQSYGAQGEVGFRIGSDPFYIEPVASIAYVRTDLGNLNALGSTIDFNKLDGLRGKAGARVGAKREIAGGAILQLYAQGSYVHEFMGTDGVRFNNGGTTFSYGNDRIPDYGEGKIGFSVASRNGVTGFAEGFGDYSRAYKGAGGRAGLRVKF